MRLRGCRYRRGDLRRRQVYRGSSSNAGELGHISLDVDGDECFGEPWCASSCSPLRAASSPPPTSTSARPRGRRRPPPLGHGAGDPRRPRPDRPCGQRRCAVCRHAIERAARYLALGTVTLVNLFDLELVVLAGHGFAHAGERRLRHVPSVSWRRAASRGRTTTWRCGSRPSRTTSAPSARPRWCCTASSHRRCSTSAPSGRTSERADRPVRSRSCRSHPGAGTPCPGR